jgi:iron(II)-dependent oxidoreductase
MDDLDDIQFIDMKNGADDAEAFASLVAAVNLRLHEAQKYRKARPLWKTATPKPNKEAPPTRTADAPDITTPALEKPTAEQEALRLARSGVRWQIIGVALSVVLGLAALAVPLLDRIGAGTLTIVAQASATPSETPAPTRDTAEISTISSFEQLQTAQMQLTHSAATQAAADLNATQDTILNANATGTAQQIMATEAAAQATLLALSWTPTLRPTNTPVPPTSTLTPTLPPPTSTSDPLEAALTAARSFTGSNADWQTVYPDGVQHTFDDGVAMMLVPAGCFEIGNDPNGRYWDGSRLIIGVPSGGRQCFDAPFWIDQTEVTQEQFTRLGGVKANANRSSGAARPVDRITWFEARDFCARRGGRLPTEAEWEYAARGPDALLYPWGDEFIAANVVNGANSNGETANVMSRPAGASWVGAHDMSGNLREWTSSLYRDYPYNPSDGREDQDNRRDVRVVRGGSFGDYSGGLRAANRLVGDPSLVLRGFGFRCTRSS